MRLLKNAIHINIIQYFLTAIIYRDTHVHHQGYNISGNREMRDKSGKNEVARKASGSQRACATTPHDARWRSNGQDTDLRLYEKTLHGSTPSCACPFLPIITNRVSAGRRPLQFNFFTCPRVVNNEYG